MRNTHSNKPATPALWLLISEEHKDGVNRANHLVYLWQQAGREAEAVQA